MSSTPHASSPRAEPARIQVGTLVVVHGKRRSLLGVCRFCGQTQFNPGVWVGIELDEPIGKNDGSVSGVEYFTCMPKHGIFAKLENVEVAQKFVSTPAERRRRKQEARSSQRRLQRIEQGLANNSNDKKVNTEHADAKATTIMQNTSAGAVRTAAVTTGSSGHRSSSPSVEAKLAAASSGSPRAAAAEHFPTAVAFSNSEPVLSANPTVGTVNVVSAPTSSAMTPLLIPVVSTKAPAGAPTAGPAKVSRTKAPASRAPSLLVADEAPQIAATSLGTQALSNDPNPRTVTEPVLVGKANTKTTPPTASKPNVFKVSDYTESMDSTLTTLHDTTNGTTKTAEAYLETPVGTKSQPKPRAKAHTKESVRERLANKQSAERRAVPPKFEEYDNDYDYYSDDRYVKGAAGCGRDDPHSRELLHRMNDLDRIGCGRAQWITLLVFAFIGLCDGQEMMVMSIINLRLRDIWGLDATHEGLLGTCVFGGFLLGALAGGPIADRYGRRAALLLFTTVLSVASFASAVSPDYTSLIAARTFVGVGIGASVPACNTIIAEMLPDRWRAFTMSVAGVAFVAGEAVTALQGLLLSAEEGDNWRVLLIMSALPSLIALAIAWPCLHESPRFYLSRGMHDRMREELEWMERENAHGGGSGNGRIGGCCCGRGGHSDGEDYGRERRGRPTAKIGNTGPKAGKLERGEARQDEDLLTQPLLAADSNDECDGATKAAAKPARSYSVMLRALCHANGKSQLMVLWLVWFLVSFVYYGIVWIFPSSLRGHGTFTEGGTPGTREQVSLKILASALAEIPGIFLPAFLLDRVGRRNLMAWVWLFAIPFAALPAGFATRLNGEVGGHIFLWALMFLKLLVGAAFCVIYIYTVESVPSWIRATAVGAGSAMARIGAIVAPLVTTWLHRDLFVGAPYWLFTGMSAAALLATLGLNRVQPTLQI